MLPSLDIVGMTHISSLRYALRMPSHVFNSRFKCIQPLQSWCYWKIIHPLEGYLLLFVTLLNLLLHVARMTTKLTISTGTITFPIQYASIHACAYFFVQVNRTQIPFFSSHRSHRGFYSYPVRPSSLAAPLG
jgi:F0F1-type ATP synthase membrane subunit a